MSMFYGPAGIGPIPGDVVVLDDEFLQLHLLLSRPGLHMQGMPPGDLAHPALCMLGRLSDRVIVRAPLAEIRMATEDEMLARAELIRALWIELRDNDGGIAWKTGA